MITSDVSNTTILSKVFKSGNSQAVRIPASLRLEADEVKISRLKDGKLLIEPIFHKQSLDKGQALLSILAEFDEDFVQSLDNSQNDKLAMQERESL